MSFASFHIVLHFVLPALVARVFYAAYWRKAFLLMAATILVDLDHLLATPIYAPERCSIGFHPLHQWLPIGIYVFLLYPKPTRLIALGLLLHMGLDGLDCQF